MDKRLKTDDKFIQMTHDLIIGLNWLKRHNLEDGDMEAIDNCIIFGHNNGNDVIAYNKYFDARHYFLDSYESDLDCINGNEWYDLVVELYKTGYIVGLKRLLTKK